MRKTISITLMSLALTACWGAPPNEKILNGLCQDSFAGDANMTALFAASGNQTIESFCSCYAATLIEDPTKIDLHKDALISIVNARDDGAMNLDQAVDQVEAAIEAGTIDTMTKAQFDGVGEDLEALLDKIGENGGSCPA